MLQARAGSFQDVNTEILRLSGPLLSHPFITGNRSRQNAAAARRRRGSRVRPPYSPTLRESYARRNIDRRARASDSLIVASIDPPHINVLTVTTFYKKKEGRERKKKEKKKGCEDI